MAYVEPIEIISGAYVEPTWRSGVHVERIVL